MPVLDCPNCDRSVHVPETAAGKQVRCPRCQEPFEVPAEDPDDERGDGREDPEPRRRPRDDERRRPAARDEEDDRPVRPRSRRRDEDEEDDRPRRSRPRSRDDDDDRPRRRRRKRSRSRGDEWSWGWSPWIGITYGPIQVGIIIAFCFLLVAGCVGLLSAH